MPNRHFNGILAENEGNVDGGRTQNLIAELYFDAIQTPKHSTQNPFYDGESFAKLAFKWNIGRK